MPRDRKELIRQYKETRRPAGVFRVRNGEARKSLVGASVDLPGMLNRQRFQLESGGHPDKELQRDWDALGPDAFVFEVLDELEPPEDPTADITEDLRVLKDMWAEKLASAGEALYPGTRR